VKTLSNYQKKIISKFALKRYFLNKKTCTSTNYWL